MYPNLQIRTYLPKHPTCLLHSKLTYSISTSQSPDGFVERPCKHVQHVTPITMANARTSNPDRPHHDIRATPRLVSRWKRSSSPPRLPLPIDLSIQRPRLTRSRRLASSPSSRTRPSLSQPQAEIRSTSQALSSLEDAGSQRPCNRRSDSPCD